MRVSARQGRVSSVARVSWLVSLLAMLNLVATVLAATPVVVGRGVGAVPNPMIELTALPQVLIAEPYGGLSSGVTVMLTDVPLGVRILAVLPDIAVGVMLMLAAATVGRVLREIGTGRSFAAESQRELRILTMVLIGGSLLAASLNLAASAVLQVIINRMDVLWVMVSVAWIDVPALYLVLGLVAAAFRFALQDGAVLEKEAEGVV